MHEANIIDYFLQKDTYKNKLNAVLYDNINIKMIYIN